MPAGRAVFFLTDYGRADELVGVVHATLVRLAPDVRVVDLTHDVPPYDVAYGARVLERAAPYLAPGVVLAVVDPGVGSSRRAVALEVETGHGPRHWVGPDNGLLLPGAQTLGAPRRAVVLDPGAGVDATGPGGATGSGGAVGAGRSGGATGTAGPGAAATFHGRDLFAPAAAALWAGTPLERLGSPVDPASLVTLPAPVHELRPEPGGGHVLRVEVTWVDRFGNVQLAADGATVPPGAGPVAVSVESAHLRSPAAEAGPELRPARRARTFGDLAPGELGLITDANGRLALVLPEASAAAWLPARAGDVLHLHW